MAAYIWTNIGSSNGLVPLLEQMVTNQQGILMAFTSGQIHKECASWYEFENYLLSIKDVSM